LVRRVAYGPVRHISAPVADSTGERYIPMSFRIISAKGEIRGAVVALLDASHFHDFHRKIDPEGGRRVAMFLTEGPVLTLFPKPADEACKKVGSLDNIFDRLPGNHVVNA